MIECYLVGGPYHGTLIHTESKTVKYVVPMPVTLDFKEPEVTSMVAPEFKVAEYHRQKIARQNEVQGKDVVEYWYHYFYDQTAVDEYIFVVHFITYVTGQRPPTLATTTRQGWEW